MLESCPYYSPAWASLEWRKLLDLPDGSLTNLFISGQHTYSENPRVVTGLRLTGILGLGALGMVIAGGILGDNVDKASTGRALRQAGVCLYAVMYIILTAVQMGAWTYRWHLKSYRRNVRILS